MNIDKIVEAVKMGVAMAGGMPVVFPAIAVCDGIAMGHVGMKYSLVTRDLIADSTEAMAIAHGFARSSWSPTATRTFLACSWPLPVLTCPPPSSRVVPCLPVTSMAARRASPACSRPWVPTPLASQSTRQ